MPLKMSKLLQDTSVEAQNAVFERYREMTPTQRIRGMFDLCTASRNFSLAGIQLRHPKCSPEELKKRFAALALGRNFTVKYLQWDPEIEGY